MKYSEIKKLATRLRNNSTPSEKILWNEIRRRKLKYKFLRQHPILYDSANNEFFFFIPDFYCSEKKLVIEVDGKIHDYHKEYDNNRSEVLKGKGLHVLRIKNEKLENVKNVIERINKVIENLS
jgi:very-short-patch-repair endonuclease